MSLTWGEGGVSANVIRAREYEIEKTKGRKAKGFRGKKRKRGKKVKWKVEKRKKMNRYKKIKARGQNMCAKECLRS